MVDRYFVLELPLLSLSSFLGFSRSRFLSMSLSLSIDLLMYFCIDDFNKILHPSSPLHFALVITSVLPEFSPMTSFRWVLEQLEPALIRVPIKRFPFDSHTNPT